MKNSKFSFKRAMALVICLCMVVTSLVFAPVVSAETEIANTNTQEYQYYDIDNTDFSASKTESASAKEDDGTGNYALRLTKRSSVATAVYGQLDQALEAGKEYSVSFYVKGKSKFFVSFTDNCGYKAGIKAVHVAGNSEKTYDNEEYTKVTLGPVTIPDDATYNSIRFMGYKVDAGSEFDSAICYIDNITIVENNNTQEIQKYDFDYVNPAKDFNQNKFFSKVTEEDGNVAIKGKTPSNGSIGYYMQLDFPVEKGKKYKVAFDYKGEEGSFWVGLFDDLNWGKKRIKFPNGGHYFSAKEEYTHYELELNSDTDLEYICLGIIAQTHSSVEVGTVYYIDNIVLTEKVDVTVGTAENGKTSVDGKAIFYGDSVDLTALPNPAYKFVKWIDDNGAEVSFANPYSFVAKEAFNITPVFEAYEATEYVRDFDNEEYNTMAPIVGNNSASVEYVYNDDIKKTVAKITIKNDNGKIAIPFVPEDGKDYRVKITYLYTKWFCLFYNGAAHGGEGPSGVAGKWLTKDWYYTQSGKDLFYLFTTKLATNAPEGEPCTIFIDSISFIESTKGDLDNDDAIDAVDITLLRKFLMGDNEKDIDLSAANVSQINDDDKIEVDVKDLVALKKKIVSNN